MLNSVKLPRIPKSVALTPSETEKLDVFCAQYTTDVDRAEKLGIDRPSFIRIRKFGSGSQANIEKIKAKIKNIKLSSVVAM